MAEYGSQDVKCPYYRGDIEKSIKCEGAINKICTQPFKSHQKKETYKEKYCCSFNYKNCPYCKMLDRKYE